jgi:hypothetical protein
MKERIKRRRIPGALPPLRDQPMMGSVIVKDDSDLFDLIDRLIPPAAMPETQPSFKNESAIAPDIDGERER